MRSGTVRHADTWLVEAIPDNVTGMIGIFHRMISTPPLQISKLSQILLPKYG
jgi:hypothetical protein